MPYLCVNPNAPNPGGTKKSKRNWPAAKRPPNPGPQDAEPAVERSHA